MKAIQTCFDEDFTSLDHKFNMSVIAFKLEQKTNGKIPLKAAQLQWAIVALFTVLLFLDFGSGLVEILTTLV